LVADELGEMVAANLMKTVKPDGSRARYWTQRRLTRRPSAQRDRQPQGNDPADNTAL
jgi:hypothetical protein